MSDRARGFTLLEGMVAMAILMIGSLGLLSLHDLGTRMNGDARIMTRATAIAEDLVTQMQTWSYATESATGGRLALRNYVDETDDFADSTGWFEREIDATVYDHEEAELDGGPWLGIPTATLQWLAPGVEFRRYWNVAPVNDDSGTQSGVKVAVVVRWRLSATGNEHVGNGAAWRRVVLVTCIYDPGAITN